MKDAMEPTLFLPELIAVFEDDPIAQIGFSNRPIEKPQVVRASLDNDFAAVPNLKQENWLIP